MECACAAATTSGPRFVDLGVDRETRRDWRALSLHGFAAMIHQDQVRDADFSEVLAERVDPEVIGQLRIAGGDMAGDSLVETESENSRKEPARRSLRCRRSSARLEKVGGLMESITSMREAIIAAIIKAIAAR